MSSHHFSPIAAGVKPPAIFDAQRSIMIVAKNLGPRNAANGKGGPVARSRPSVYAAACGPRVTSS